MRTTSIIALLFLAPFLTVVPTEGQEVGTTDALQQLIALSEEARHAALNGDAKWQDQHLAEGFTAIEPNGEIKSRAEAIQMRKAGALKFESIEVRERKVRVFGDTALVIAKATLRLTSALGT